MSTAAQIAFDETAEFFSPAASRNHFQLLTDLTAQAASDVDLSALIKGFVDSVARAFRCDCVCIALLDPEDSRAFREFLVQYPHDDRRVQQPPIISKEETQRLSKIVEQVQTASFAGVESAAHAVAGVKGFKTQCHFPLVNRGRALGVLTLAFSIEATFHQAELTCLQQVAAQIAIAIANARAHQQIAATSYGLRSRYMLHTGKASGFISY
jgi:formate hydrogenlyase transcriptional activator